VVDRGHHVHDSTATAPRNRRPDADHDGDGVEVDGLVHLTTNGHNHSPQSLLAAGRRWASWRGSNGRLPARFVQKGHEFQARSRGNTNASAHAAHHVSGATTAPRRGDDPIYGDATVTNRDGGLIQGTAIGHAVVARPCIRATRWTNRTIRPGATIKGAGRRPASARREQQLR